MHPDLWGPFAWHLLHTVAYSVRPGSAKTPYRRFFQTYETILPCDQCKVHYKNWVIANPINKIDNYSSWVNDLHNSVCEMNGKDTWSSDSVRKLYFSDGVLQVSHAKIFMWIDIVVENAMKNTNIEQFQDYIIFFNTLRDIFPCPTCGKKLRELMIKYPINEVVDANSLQEWYALIASEWKEEHQHLNINVYLVYSKPNNKECYYRKIRKKGAKHVKKVGNRIVFMLPGDTSKEIILPKDMLADVATDVDIDYIRKIKQLGQK